MLWNEVRLRLGGSATTDRLIKRLLNEDRGLPNKIIDGYKVFRSIHTKDATFHWICEPLMILSFQPGNSPLSSFTPKKQNDRVTTQPKERVVAAKSTKVVYVDSTTSKKSQKSRAKQRAKHNSVDPFDATARKAASSHLISASQAKGPEHEDVLKQVNGTCESDHRARAKARPRNSKRHKGDVKTEEGDAESFSVGARAMVPEFLLRSDAQRAVGRKNKTTDGIAGTRQKQKLTDAPPPEEDVKTCQVDIKQPAFTQEVNDKSAKARMTRKQGLQKRVEAVDGIVHPTKSRNARPKQRSSGLSMWNCQVVDGNIKEETGWESMDPAVIAISQKKVSSMNGRKSSRCALSPLVLDHYSL